MNPAIVVIAYNRTKSLIRLLNSLLEAVYPKSHITLVISIDKSIDNSVVNIAKDFDWPYGDKKLIIHQQRLGLRKHVLSCGDLVERYGSTILLEDDLFVSPYFYIYALTALEFYKTEKDIAGISLYSMKINETASRPFNVLYDGYDVYFLQLPSSWGQAWTEGQWMRFRDWYNKSRNNNDVLLPPNVASWPETSWKKYFMKYMIVANKYFVYPRISLTTNFGDKGEHLKGNAAFLQVSLLINNINFRFTTLSNSLAVYDAYMEILPKCLTRFNSKLEKYDFEVDLYGTKPYNSIKKTYVLTSKRCDNYSLSFSRDLKPHEVNVLYNNYGNYFRLCETNMLRSSKIRLGNTLMDWNYYLPYGLSTKKMIIISVLKIIKYIKLKLKI